MMWEELGISGGTALVILIALYFIVKWAVKNGVKEALEDIRGRKNRDDLDEILEQEDAGEERKEARP